MKYLKKTGVTIAVWDVSMDIATTSPDALLSDIISMAAETKYPIAVITEDGNLKGIVSKAQVLSSMS